jgi:glutamate-5-semialdehyde dehydrogenase
MEAANREVVTGATLVSLEQNQAIVYGGNRVASVSAELAAAFSEGDRLIVDASSGALLHIPDDEHAVATAGVDTAIAAFRALALCSDDQISRFFDLFADRLADDESFRPILEANQRDLERAAGRGRSTTRLVLSESMRDDMISGLRGWVASASRRDVSEGSIEHAGWSVEAQRAPLGVVAFVFEGRPNVFADAAGVVRTGNTVVFRIGSDALDTARAIVANALDPALEESGLPPGSVSLVDSAAHAAGWALFSDSRISLAVARGSGQTVAQLGAVARQAGIPVSLHGTGGAWLVVAADADVDRFAAAVMNSLDRKVCNTLNVCCIVREQASELVPIFLTAVTDAAGKRQTDPRVHATRDAMAFVSDVGMARRSVVVRADGEHDEPFVSPIDICDLSVEWEWEASPEVSLHIVDDVDEAIALCNRLSPKLVASLVSESDSAHDAFYSSVDTPFVGDGFTRWVDGQYALNAPELGLSNWEGGRMLGRGGVLSGDSVYTIRYRARIANSDLAR